VLQLYADYRHRSESVDAASIQEVTSTLVSAERRSPGIVDSFVSELVHRLIASSPTQHWTAAVDTALHKTKRYAK